MRKGYKTIAKKRWPRAWWIADNGPWAVVSSCRSDGETVVLCETKKEAEISKQRIDDTGCGGHCRNKHEIVNLDD